jgi:hypothetical protein
MMEIGISEGTLGCNFPLAIIMATSAPKHEGYLCRSGEHRFESLKAQLNKNQKQFPLRYESQPSVEKVTLHYYYYL